MPIGQPDGDICFSVEHPLRRIDVSVDNDEIYRDTQGESLR
jgi:hypothetical protein